MKIQGGDRLTSIKNLLLASIPNVDILQKISTQKKYSPSRTTAYFYRECLLENLINDPNLFRIIWIFKNSKWIGFKVNMIMKRFGSFWKDQNLKWIYTTDFLKIWSEKDPEDEKDPDLPDLHWIF